MNKVIRFLWSKIGKSKPLFYLMGLVVLGGGVAGAWLGLGHFKSGRPQHAGAGRDGSNSESLQSEPGQVQVYFTHPGSSPGSAEDVAAVLVGCIDRAERTVDVCAFELDSRAITEALVRAVRRGVKVRLVTETASLGQGGVRALKEAGVPVVDDGRPALMHNKFMVFDDRVVWTGSMDFTESGVYRDHNNALCIEDAKVAANFATRFAWMFEQHQFGGRPSRETKVPHPSVTLGDGTRIDTYFSTFDHPADRLIEKISQAKTSIHFLTFRFSHAGIARAILDRARAGIPVQGVFDLTQAAAAPSQYGKFFTAGPGVQVHFEADGRALHHKAILLDGETVATGSFDFSEQADRENDENMVIVHSRKVAQQFEEEFFRICDAARKTGNGVAAMTPRLHK